NFQIMLFARRDARHLVALQHINGIARVVDGYLHGLDARMLHAVHGIGQIFQDQIVRLALVIAEIGQPREAQDNDDIDEYSLHAYAPAASPRSSARARTLSACRRQACSTRANEMMP